MKEIKLSKVTEAEAEVLQQELQHYAAIVKLGFKFISSDDFYNALLITDVALRMWLTFRKKLESDQDKFTIRLKISEAVVLLKCCYWSRDGRTDYQAFIAEKFKNNIDQQLKSLNFVTT